MGYILLYPVNKLGTFLLCAPLINYQKQNDYNGVIDRRAMSAWYVQGYYLLVIFLSR